MGAATAVRLPTDGYVRPGRYFPVEVSASTTLRADRCLPCDVTASGRATVPMLAVSSPGPLVWPEGTVPLRVPADHERLVGATGDSPALFPGERIIPVRLDPADPLPGPAAAWEVLDAVVLDRAAMSGVSDERRSVLLAGGVLLAATGDVAPDDRWPWQRRDGVWMLSYFPAGPSGAVAEAAYAPTEAWTPGWSVAVRREAVGAGVLICVLTVAAILAWHRRPWVAGVMGVAIPLLATGGVVVWRRTLDPTSYGVGEVTVSGGGFQQRDTWVYARARADSDVTTPWKGWTHPVFPSDESVGADRARLTVAADGGLAFTTHLAAGTAMAFVRREVGTGAPPAITGGQGGAMRTIAPLYLSMGDRVVGETTVPAGRWAGVEIARSDRGPPAR